MIRLILVDLMRDKIEKFSLKSNPRGLIFEAYRIEKITFSDCRSIFFDWALSIAEEFDPLEEVKKLYDIYSIEFNNHPMTAVLLEGLNEMPKAVRRRKRKLQIKK